MEGLGRSRRLLVAAGALVAVFVLAGGAAAEHRQKPNVGGTVAFGHDFIEPLCLSSYRSNCFIDSARLALLPVLAGAYRQQPDLTFEPMLVDEVKIGKSPFTLTYRIERRAKWSDGTPLTAEDFIFTLESVLDPANDVDVREGYDRIVEATALDPKTVRFVFSSPFPAWKSLFPEVLPKHALEGHDFDTYWTNDITNPSTGEPIGSGPFLLSSFVRGDRMTLNRNPNWWGPHPAYLDTIVIRFFPPLDEPPVAQALSDGLVDVINPQLSQPTLAGLPGIEFQSSPSASRQHLDLNVSSTTMPLLRELWFREAVAYSLDRPGAAAAAANALAGPSHGVTQSLTYLIQQPEYRRHFAGFSYDPRRVGRIMRRHGCELGSDGIWSCGGVRASLRLTAPGSSSGPSPLTAAVSGHLRTAARAAGIELVPENVFAGTFFTIRLPAGDFDLAMFASGTVDDVPPVNRYGCGAAFNFTRYCSDEVTRLLEEADEEMSPSRRRSLINRADAIMADDLPSIPLYQRPMFLYARSNLRGIVDHPGSAAGPTWNAEEWWIADE